MTLVPIVGWLPAVSNHWVTSSLPTRRPTTPPCQVCVSLLAFLPPLDACLAASRARRAEGEGRHIVMITNWATRARCFWCHCARPGAIHSPSWSNVISHDQAISSHLGPGGGLIEQRHARSVYLPTLGCHRAVALTASAQTGLLFPETYPQTHQARRRIGSRNGAKKQGACARIYL